LTQSVLGKSVLNKALQYEGIGGSGRKLHPFLTPKCTIVETFTHPPHGKQSMPVFVQRLLETQSRSARFGEQNYLLPMKEVDPRFTSTPVRSTYTISTGLSIARLTFRYAPVHYRLTARP